MQWKTELTSEDLDRPLRKHHLSNSKTSKSASVSVSVTIISAGKLKSVIGNDFSTLNPTKLLDFLPVTREVGVSHPETTSQNVGKGSRLINPEAIYVGR